MCILHIFNCCIGAGLEYVIFNTDCASARLTPNWGGGRFPVLQAHFFEAQEQLRPDALLDATNDVYQIQTHGRWVTSPVL